MQSSSDIRVASKRCNADLMQIKSGGFLICDLRIAICDRTLTPPSPGLRIEKNAERAELIQNHQWLKRSEHHCPRVQSEEVKRAPLAARTGRGGFTELRRQGRGEGRALDNQPILAQPQFSSTHF
jgi:hypothetical protein